MKNHVGVDGKDLLNIYVNDKAPKDLDPMGESQF